MSKQDDKIEVEGLVVKALPNMVFEIQLPESYSGVIIQGRLSGKMSKHNIRIVPGDGVLIELSVYDLSKGRIVKRLDNNFKLTN